MPKSAAGITKDRRKRAIIEVIERWGRMKIDQIAQRLSALLAIDTSAAKRTLYRDLEELVNEGVLTDVRFTRDGARIDDFDPETHKNTTCEWALKELENVPGGAALIKSLGGQLLVSKLVREKVRLTQSLGGGRDNLIECFFQLANEFFCLNFDSDFVPYDLLIARSQPPSSGSVNLGDLEKWFGRRLVVLSLPVVTVSAIRSDKERGHCLVRVGSLQNISVQDLGSTNGTAYSELTERAAKELIERSELFSNKTRTSSWLVHTKQPTQFSAIEPNLTVQLKVPALLSLSERQRVLLCSGNYSRLKKAA